MDDISGCIVARKYIVDKCVGSGKFGNVYKGINTKTNEIVALKLEDQRTSFKMLKRETAIMNYLYEHNCRNIPCVHWFGQLHNSMCMVMPYYECSLYEYGKLKTLSENKLDALMVQCIRILQSIHTNMVLHRDIKPQNFMVKNGILGGVLKTRNEEIASLEKQLNTIAHSLVLSTNAIHRRGFANHSVPEDANGNPILSATNKKITGINFFKEPLDVKRAAEFIKLDDAIEEDINNIVTAFEPNKPGDNRISLAISKLQHEKILEGGTATFEEQYLKSVGEIGLQSGKTKIDLEQSSGIYAQAKSVKEKLTGVSLDEEAANMVKYQNAYEASAKVIKASDEMFRAVLGILP